MMRNYIDILEAQNEKFESLPMAENDRRRVETVGWQIREDDRIVDQVKNVIAAVKAITN
jgi:hypothetical protein